MRHVLQDWRISYFHFIFKSMIDNWWSTSNHLLVLGNYIEDTHIFRLPPPPPPTPFLKYRMLRGVNYCDFFYWMSWSLKNPQNCTYGDDVLQDFATQANIVRQNVIKTLNIVICYSRDDVPLKCPKKICRPDNLDSTPLNQSNWSGRGRFYVR